MVGMSLLGTPSACGGTSSAWDGASGLWLVPARHYLFSPSAPHEDPVWAIQEPYLAQTTAPAAP